MAANDVQYKVYFNWHQWTICCECLHWLSGFSILNSRVGILWMAFSHLVTSVGGRPSGGKRGPQPVYVCGGCRGCASCCLWLTVFVSCKCLVMLQPVHVCVVCVCGVRHALCGWLLLYVVNVLWCLSLSMQVVSSPAYCFIISVAGIPVLNATWLWLILYP